MAIWGEYTDSNGKPRIGEVAKVNKRTVRFFVCNTRVDRYGNTIVVRKPGDPVTTQKKARVTAIWPPNTIEVGFGERRV